MSDTVSFTLKVGTQERGVVMNADKFFDDLRTLPFDQFTEHNLRYMVQQLWHEYNDLMLAGPK